jgi:hypothetical protein
MLKKRLGTLAGTLLPAAMAAGCTQEGGESHVYYGPRSCTSNAECDYAGGFCNPATQRCDFDRDAAAEDGDGLWVDAGQESAPDAAWDSIDESDALPPETGDEDAVIDTAEDNEAGD